jgi:hypothetical protein
MPVVRIAEAARLAGVNQSTQHRAMRTGRLSYSAGPTGKWRMDIAELSRVFDLGRFSGVIRSHSRKHGSAGWWCIWEQPSALYLSICNTSEMSTSLAENLSVFPLQPDFGGNHHA